MKAVITARRPARPHRWRCRACTTSSTTAWRATKALYDGHAVAAVAAVDARTARQALKLIEVDYELLPHVTDVDEAMKHIGPAHQRHYLHRRPRGKAGEALQRHQAQPSSAMAMSMQGFEQADVIVERSFKTEQTHQGYIEPHACVASVSSDGTARPLGLHAGPFRLPPALRASCSAWKPRSCASPRRRSAAASAARRMSGPSRWRSRCRARPDRPVKLVMTRDEVFRASGPTCATSIDVKIGATQGRHASPPPRRRCAIPAAPIPAPGPRSAP